MKALRVMCTAGLLAAASVAAPAQARGILSLPPASHIVGTWANLSYVGPCGGAPGAPQAQTLVFHAGGTFLDVPRFPPNGIPNLSGIPGVHQRSVGVGTWSYDSGNREYTLEQRFDWYVDGAYHGYQVVERTIFLGDDRMTADGPVRTVRYDAAGQPVFELCGVAESTRI